MNFSIRWLGGLIGIFPIAIVVISVGYSITTLPSEHVGLSELAISEIGRSGTSNPVTAVLLNFRSYDTLLEVGVLLLAVLAAWALVGGWANEVCLVSEVANPVLRGFVRVMAPIAVLVSGYLLWSGGYRPGGAFQAGAILASAGIVLFMAGVDWSQQMPAWVERSLLTVGLFVFLLVGLIVILFGGFFLQYPQSNAKLLILLIEAACGLSIAAALIAVFLGGRLRSKRAVWGNTNQSENPNQ